MSKIKQIITSNNIIVFDGCKNCVDTSSIKYFFEKGSDIYGFDFEESQAYFTPKTKIEIQQVIEQIEKENKKNINNEDFEQIDIIQEIKAYSFDFKHCNYVF